MLKDEIKNGETDVLEFKRDMPDDHLKFLKTAVAFANSNGGRIIFGVEDDRTLVGVDALGAFALRTGSWTPSPMPVYRRLRQGI